MNKVLVWDIPTRLFHWLIAILIFFQWFTTEILDDAIDLHMYGGYALLGLILFRVIWGLVGTRYARFSNFIYRPSDVLAYSKELAVQNSTPYPGHNPVGGLAVLAFLIVILLQAVSGLFIDDDVFSSGPYYSAVSSDIQNIMSIIHHRLFDLLLILIGVHLVAVAFYIVYKKQPLISAMLHGKKPIAEAQAINNHNVIKALIIVLLVAVFMYFLVEVWPPEAEEYYY